MIRDGRPRYVRMGWRRVESGRRGAQYRGSSGRREGAAEIARQAHTTRSGCCPRNGWR
jgi:hypothetical protein